jgi:predicted transposase YbfD/YdcC
LFTVKDNHKAKREEIEKQFFIHNPEGFTVCDKGHGRLETRTLQLMIVPKHLEEWPGVKQILKMTRTREIKGKMTIETAYGITSLSEKSDDIQRIMSLWRGHWGIENKLHWVRDEVFREDRCTIRKGSSPQIMAALRNLIIGLACKLRIPTADMLAEFARFHKRAIKMVTEK